jgi:hypothetical protein
VAFSRAEVFRAINQRVDERPASAEKRALGEHVGEIASMLDVARDAFEEGGDTRYVIREIAALSVAALMEHGAPMGRWDPPKPSE